jgi:hypothetical protein
MAAFPWAGSEAGQKGAVGWPGQGGPRRSWAKPPARFVKTHVSIISVISKKKFGNTKFRWRFRRNSREILEKVKKILSIEIAYLTIFSLMHGLLSTFYF